MLPSHRTLLVPFHPFLQDRIDQHAERQDAHGRKPRGRPRGPRGCCFEVLHDCADFSGCCHHRRWCIGCSCCRVVARPRPQCGCRGEGQSTCKLSLICVINLPTYRRGCRCRFYHLSPSNAHALNSREGTRHSTTTRLLEKSSTSASRAGWSTLTLMTSHTA